MELTDHDVHCLYLHHPDQLVWCKDDRSEIVDNRRVDESSCILYEHSDESDDAVYGICHDFHEYGKYAAVWNTIPFMAATFTSAVPAGTRLLLPQGRLCTVPICL